MLKNQSKYISAVRRWFWRPIIKKVKAWGVIFESDLPPEFVITIHAEERMSQRIKCRRDKMIKLAMKAWESKEKLDPVFLNRKEYQGQVRGIEYRQLMGYVYIFNVRYVAIGNYYQKRLVTVYN